MLKLTGFVPAVEIDKVAAREMRFAVEEFNQDY